MNLFIEVIEMLGKLPGHNGITLALIAAGLGGGFEIYTKTKRGKSCERKHKIIPFLVRFFAIGAVVAGLFCDLNERLNEEQAIVDEARKVEDLRLTNNLQAAQLEDIKAKNIELESRQHWRMELSNSPAFFSKLGKAQKIDVLLLFVNESEASYTLAWNIEGALKTAGWNATKRALTTNDIITGAYRWTDEKAPLAIRARSTPIGFGWFTSSILDATQKGSVQTLRDALNESGLFVGAFAFPSDIFKTNIPPNTIELICGS